MKRLVALALALAACSHAPPDPRCALLVTKIFRCDPTSAGVSRATLEAQCVPERLHCAALDVSTATGCQRFMGCLYDG